MIPFKQETFDNYIIRTFSDEMDQDDYYWHKDKDDRTITVLSCGYGWKYQQDDCLPINLYTGLSFNIPRATWHRVIKGKEDLVIKIQKS